MDKKIKGQPFELAVYGKGGIGKSTMSANLSAALAKGGKRVLQIGCDPKHDSTRYLMHGETIPTVLEYLREVPKEQGQASAILKEGCFGIGCIEAGGPRPGVGCAGRGIISAFEFLKEHHVKESYDLVVYDVLGDVVCGGFAVPVRKEYANAVFLVTSGEYMALYAANNILRGIRNYDGESGKRVAGIIYNSRKIADEDGRVQRFARAVGLPIIVKVPRSSAFARAEEEKLTVMEIEGFEEEKQIFRGLAERIRPDMPLYAARPLEDELLEEVVLNLGSSLPAADAEIFSRTGSEGQSENTENADCQDNTCSSMAVQEKGKTADKDMDMLPERPPLYGCAFTGAATMAVHVTDALVIAHSPKACAFYTWQNISSTGRKNLFNRGILMPSAISPSYACTEMGQTEAVFGGMDKLRLAVEEAMAAKPGVIIVISSCVSGIIGDDIREIEAMSTPDIKVIAIHADGDVAGDYMTGIRMCLHTVIERLADPDVSKKDKCVNLINETGVSNNIEVNYRNIRNLLKRMGIEVNCRLLGDASVAELHDFFAAPLNLMVNDDPSGRELQGWLEQSYGVRFLDMACPIGFEETALWLRKIGDFFNCREAAEQIINEEKDVFLSEAAKLRPYLEGKRIVMTTINANMDWLLTAAEASGMKFVWIGVLNYLRQDVKITDHPERYTIEESLDWQLIRNRVREYAPDLVLSNYTSVVEKGPYIVDAMPMTQCVGFDSGIRILRRWADLFRSGKEGEWTNDRALFEKYFA